MVLGPDGIKISLYISCSAISVTTNCYSRAMATDNVRYQKELAICNSKSKLPDSLTSSEEDECGSKATARNAWVSPYLWGTNSNS